MLFVAVRDLLIYRREQSGGREVWGAVPQLVVFLGSSIMRSRSRGREGNLHHPPILAAGPLVIIPIGLQEQGFIDNVGNHQNGAAVIVPDFQQFFL